MDEGFKKTKKKHLGTKLILGTISILLLIIVICVLLYCFLLLKNKDNIMDTNTQAIIQDEKVIEYGTSLTYDDIINQLISENSLYDGTEVKLYVNDKLMTKDDTYLFDTIGDITIHVETYAQISKLFNKATNTSYQITWKVQDTKKPVLSGVKDIEITEGDQN